MDTNVHPISDEEKRAKEETKDLRLFAVKTDKECRCCGKKFGFMTHGHAVIVADAENKNKLPFPKEEDIVFITMFNISGMGLVPIDVCEYVRLKGLENPELEGELEGSEMEEK